MDTIRNRQSLRRSDRIRIRNTTNKYENKNQTQSFPKKVPATGTEKTAIDKFSQL
jgi:hypothetical protein